MTTRRWGTYTLSSASPALRQTFFQIPFQYFASVVLITMWPRGDGSDSGLLGTTDAANGSPRGMAGQQTGRSSTPVSMWTPARPQPRTSGSQSIVKVNRQINRHLSCWTQQQPGFSPLQPRALTYKNIFSTLLGTASLPPVTMTTHRR